jgi:hypothetical protein
MGGQIMKKKAKDQEPEERIQLDSKVWVPLEGNIVAGIVIQELIWGEYIVEVRGKQYHFDASQVKRRQH